MDTKLKGGEFLIKDATPEQIFIVDDFSEEQMMMADAATEFVNKEILPHEERLENKDYKLIEELMKKAGEMGFLGITTPEKYDGLDMGFNTSMLVTDRLSAVSGSFGTAYGAHTGIGTLPILLYGTEEQRVKYLPLLGTGEWIGAYALTEPGAGSDANSGKTKAVYNEATDTYQITGGKMWISNAGFANVFIVFARIEKDKNITGFIIDYDAENPNGISFGEEEHKLGIKSSSTRQVFFDKTEVPASAMLSERGNGFKIAMNSLNVGRIKLAAACIDAQKRLVTYGVTYANERVQFKQPISSFGAIKSKIAEMATATWVSEAGTYRTGQDIEDKIAELETTGLTPQESKLKGVEEYAIESSIMKVYVSEALQDTADEAIQIYGGMGFSSDAPVESAWRDARITRIYEGTNEVNKMLIVGMLLRKAMKGDIDLMTPAMKVVGELMSIPSFDTPDYSVLLSEEKEILGKLKKAVLMVAGKAVEAFGMDLSEEQEVLMLIAEMIIELYVAESALLRAEKYVSKNGEKAGEMQIAMAQLNLHHAVEKLGKSGREAITTIVEGDEQRMMLMGLKRFTKYNNYPNLVALRRKIANKLIEENKYMF
ncbi:MAG: acyl-CoA dehydrogenase family protein [Ichthyobacteriaceae bacterium]|nr:acyl-CoA dehydrogenase family protein [Ichthyobacteriaceae bacterium]